MEKDFRKNEKSLARSLKDFSEGSMYPLHMPGHKRNPNSGAMAEYMDIDITEIDDYDNLHDPEGIIKDAEDRANELYGAEKTFFLVNGSTCGVLAAVSAAVPKGGKIIAARNVHKSFSHAVYLRELETAFVMPENAFITKRGLVEENSYTDDACEKNSGFVMGRIIPQDVERSFKENPDASAVFITSPTYDGIASDVRAIAEIAHSRGAVLIVDEAHGAHFGLYNRISQKSCANEKDNADTLSGLGIEIPEGAISQGADIVIHSVHKTLASMTQTALIHIVGERIDREKLRRFLRIYQSSSPSYVLMASIDSCIKDINDRGKEIFERLLKYRSRLEEETKDLDVIYVLPWIAGQDPGKVLVCAAEGAVTGQQIYDILRVDYNLQCEMAGDTYALAIVTGYDTEEGIARLSRAIRDLDRRLLSGEFKEIRKKGLMDSNQNSGLERPSLMIPETVVPFYKAWDGKNEEVDLSAASGRVAGDFINLYPPGIPLVIPGEQISKELVRELGEYINEGRNVQGVRIRENGARLISCLQPE